MKKNLPHFSALYFLFFIPFFFSCNPADKEKDKPQYAGLSDSTTYVGIQTCRQCHQGVYETFIETGMGKSIDHASHLKSSAKFDKHALIYDRFRNFRYQPFWQNDSLYVKEFRLEGRDTIYQRTEKISYIVGSGQHTNSHIMETNGYAYQVPATFYTQKGTWDLPPGFENGFNSRFSRKIELECMSCHNGYPKIVMGSENKYDFIPNGIDCERCHGPGSEHVRQKQLGNLIDTSKAIDYSIVNPAKLPVALQLDICQRCHIQGNAVLNEGKTFFDFRPAMQLSEVMNVFMPVFKGDEDSHIMASHVERLKMSKCFINTVAKAQQDSKNKLKPYKDAMTCVTCHNPHVSVKVTNSDVFNNACRNCHNVNSTSNIQHSTLLCSESIEKRKAINDNCVTCHMPKNGTIDIPHVTTTDHYIRKPVNKATVQKIREFVGLACINNSNPSKKIMAGAYLSYFEKFSSDKSSLDSAKKYLNDATNDDVKSNFKNLVRWAYLKNDFTQVIGYDERAGGGLNLLSTTNYSNEDSWTSYRIGEAYHAAGDIESAIRFFQRAVDLEKYNLEFRNKLASAEMDAGKNEDARKNFEFILHENPEFTSAWINLGYLLLSVDHNVSAADLLYDKALALDPDNEQALLNKAGTLMYLGKKSEAKKILQRILKVNPENEKAKKVLQSFR
jgi:tetratricopeptide (TPR) repeat protein